MQHLKFSLTALLAVSLAFLLGCGGGGGGGLFSPDSGFDPSAYTFKALTAANTPTLTSADVRALAQSSGTARLYTGTGNGLLVSDPTQAAPTFAPVAGLPAGQAVNALLFARNGRLWVGTDNGLFTIDTVSGAVNAIASFAGSRILSLAEQGSGVYWVGMANTTASTTSVARSENGTAFTFFGRDAGMTASSVVRIFASDNPSLVVACGLGQAGSAGLFRYKSNGKFEQMDDSPFNNGATLFHAVGTTYYAGGPGKGLQYQATREGEWKTVLPDVTPLAIDIAPYGAAIRAWVGSDQGLHLSFNLTNFKIFKKSNGLASDTCNVVSQANWGTFIGHSGTTGGISIAQLVGQ